MPWLRRIAATFLLPAWFTIFALVILYAQWGEWGVDTLLYHAASAAWRTGGNPWDVVIYVNSNPFHFYALPPSVILLWPFSFVPTIFVQPLGMLVCAASAIYVIRRLALPWWWLSFPPLVSGVIAGNPSIPLLAALLASHPAVQAIAPTLKVYALLPLLGEQRWRAMAIAGAFVVASLVIAPRLWFQFADSPLEREAQLARESAGGFSAFGMGPAMLILAIVGLLILARYNVRSAGWLAASSVWPGAQLHWATLGMPIATPLIAAILAVPKPGTAVLAVAVLGLRELRRSLHDRALKRNTISRVLANRRPHRGSTASPRDDTAGAGRVTE